MRHEPLVVYAVNRQNLGDLPFDEAVQAGWIGLWRAILRYDPDRGYRFSTYAYPAIVHRVWAAVKDHCVANRKAHATREWVVFFRHWETGPAQRQAEQALQACLQELVMRLPAQLRQIIEIRYELGGRQWQTYAQLGAALGYSREWVRLKEIEALVWLRQPAYSQALRTLLQRHSQREYEWVEEMAQVWLRRRGGRRRCQSVRDQHAET
jgi:RNA polymerase sigma factor (sigma-70 family)